MVDADTAVHSRRIWCTRAIFCRWGIVATIRLFSPDTVCRVHDDGSGDHIVSARYRYANDLSSLRWRFAAARRG